MDRKGEASVPSPRRNAMFFALMVLIAWAALEAVFFGAGRLLQSKWAMWRPPTGGSPLTYAQYLALRDPVVGWPYPRQYGEDLDVNGAQRNLFYPDGPRSGSCVSLYGDSFTAGGDTSSPDRNWGHVLSKTLSCYVANFGVGGYGSDQAYLRFARNATDPSPVVVFGFHTEDVLRNLTRVRDLQNYTKWYSLKPRFVLGEQGAVSLVPMPVLSEEEYLRVVGLAGDLLPLENESFQPGGPAGAVGLEFPYSLAVVKNMLRFHGFRSRVLRRPEWMEFLEPGHPLHGLEITLGTTQEFVQLARQRNKASLVVVLPHLLDFRYFADRGVWPYRPLVDAYTKQSIQFVDFGPYLLAAARKSGRRIEEFFGPTLHYNDEGNALLARLVADRLAAGKLQLAPLELHPVAAAPRQRDE